MKEGREPYFFFLSHQIVTGADVINKKSNISQKQMVIDLIAMTLKSNVYRKDYSADLI